MRKESLKNDLAYDLFVVQLDEIDRAIVESEEAGFAKILTVKGSDKILGATIVGPPHAYPTFAELARKAGDKCNKTRLTPFAKKLFAWLYRRAR